MATHTTKSAVTNSSPPSTLEGRWCTRAMRFYLARTSKIRTYWSIRAKVLEPQWSSKIWWAGEVHHSGTCPNSTACNADPFPIQSKTTKESGIRVPIHPKNWQGNTTSGIKINNLMRRRVRISISYNSLLGKVGDRTPSSATTKNYHKPTQNLKLCPFTTSSITHNHLDTITIRMQQRRHHSTTVRDQVCIFRIMIHGSLLTPR